MEHLIHWPKGLDDATFWVLVGLALFIGLVMYLGVPGMITKALDERSAKIANQLEDAKRTREEAQELLATFQRRQREAESEAEEIIAQAKRDAAHMADRMRDELSDRLARRAEMSERKIAQAEADALELVRRRSADLAVRAAETVLKEGLNESGRAAFIDRAIADMPSKLS